ncbi:RsmE family RNA methyltransferase [Veillonella criceti]|uniref:Ribosomal RNA small subunit methyltransferase E n=1 Tax=Veillonella criceti TaxID=103891 RepID=A0A380NJ55_9FIRM|nr:RsmE family RNA methyltransferase [Veillonella criceti]SUP41059.1 Ribosomal RNA small subunit methyltransferase E [Veillonella criceti]
MKKIFVSTPLDTEIIIPKETTHHLITVFRHNIEKPILVSSSEGGTATYRILEVVDGEAKAKRIGEVTTTETEEIEIVLVQAFLKADKLEWVLQKATELNVHTVYAVPMKHCVAQYKADKLPQKVERWQKIMKEAAQQCGREQLPQLVVQQSVADVLANEVEQDTLVLVAYENESSHTLKEALQGNSNQRVLIIIGPEGGLSEEEVLQMTEVGAQVVTLGSTILRAETAAISAVSMLQYELNM